MADEFFDANQETAGEEAPVEKIKVGDEEFTQEELAKLVGLGKIGAEAESKYKTKIDRVWPQFQTVINEKRQLEDKIKEYETKANEPKIEPTKEQLTAEQVKAEAIKQAKELGLVTKEDFEKAVTQKTMEIIQGQNLINDISEVIDNMATDGLPSTTVEDVLQHMQETGIKNPEKAYKDMFEKEWVKSQMDKVNSLKKAGLPTTERSTAGSKEPAPVKLRGMSDSDLANLVSESLKGSYE